MSLWEDNYSAKNQNNASFSPPLNLIIKDLWKSDTDSQLELGCAVRHSSTNHVTDEYYFKAVYLVKIKKKIIINIINKIKK